MSGRSEEGSPAGALVTVGVCGVLGVAGLAAAVGAVVPAVGDAMNLKSTGVGGMLGYLLGAALFGSPAVFGVLALRRRRVAGQAPTAAPAALAGRPVVALPDGPGLTARWLAATPLMLLSAFAPFVGQKMVTAWSQAADDTTFAGAFWAEVTGNWAPACLPALIVAGFLLWRTAFGSWPAACRYAALAVLIPATLITVALEEPLTWLRDAAVAAGLVWLSHELAVLTLHVLTRPVAEDVVRSRLEIMFPLPGQRPRLRVKHDRLVLDRLHQYPALAMFDSDTTRIALPWREIRDAQVDEQHVDRTWTPVDGETTTIRVPAGPAVRITAGDGTWLIPVGTELTAHTIVAVVRNRSAAPARG